MFIRKSESIRFSVDNGVATIETVGTGSKVQVPVEDLPELAAKIEACAKAIPHSEESR